MRWMPRWLPTATLVGVAALVLAGCPAPAPETEPPAADPAVNDGEPETRELYEARLEEVGGSGVRGTATVTIDGARLQVTVVASGLEPDARVPQHVHANASCEAAGGILLNLDEQLSAANESAPRGDHYPRSDGAGDLEYEASRPLNELETALLEQDGPGLDGLNLGNRVVNLHGADMQAVACGPLERRE